MTRAIWHIGNAVVLTLLLALPTAATAGAQRYEPLATSVRAALHRAVSDRGAPRLVFDSAEDGEYWLQEMSRRLERKIPDRLTRVEFLTSVQYEARRAGLDPQLVLGLIQVESNFRKYSVSSAGARGYMQVMPFWVKQIGRADDNLFHLRTSLRYGCTILRHYLDIESGNLFRALGRYNGSLGKAAYPNLVHQAWTQRWAYQPPPGRSAAQGRSVTAAATSR